MTALDDLDLFTPTTAANPAAPPSKKCYRHDWQAIAEKDGVDVCWRCGKERDPERSRRGRLNKNRGKAIEREVCALLGWLQIGGANGPADGLSMTGDAMFIGQVKSGGRFPGWMAAELDKLPRTGGRIPVLAVAQTPGPGRKRRVLVVLDANDWRDLHAG